MRDYLTPALDRIDEADALVLGSPIYFGCVTGETCSFLERFPFPYLAYTNPPSSIFECELATAIINTMNPPEERLEAAGYPQLFTANEQLPGRPSGGRPVFSACSRPYS
ncbi:MAG: NAD(P)H-dependent oxidoreductase [Methanospirillum sp.]